jgi:sigma-54-dependent transcriptional regulator
VKDPVAIAEELIELTTALATERRLETLLSGVVGAACRLTEAEGGRILVLDRVGRELYCIHAQNEANPAAAACPSAVPLYRGDGGFNLTEPSAFAAITGRLLAIADVYAYSGFDFAALYERDRATGYRTRGFLVLPLRGPGEATLGVLQLVNAPVAAGGTLPAAHERAVRSFAAHAAVAIGNARLFEENRQLIRQLDRANAELASENTILRTAVERTSAGSAVIGDSPPLAAALDLARRAAGARVPVLLLGETGTGKEVFSRFVHQASERRNRPFVVQNCASLPETLLESELFGHRRGAFSGAVADKKGLVQEASGGTLFLDEIGDMPLGLQAKILRLIEEGEVRRLGDTRPEKIDVRIVAATNVDLKRGIAEGAFREDLFYRLSVFPITLPPLRERPSDVPQLLDAFLARAASAAGRRVPPLTPRALDALLRWRYPGNVRELKNIAERAVLLVDDGERIDLAHLPAELAGRGGAESLAVAPHLAADGLKAALGRVEALIIETRLREAGGNQGRAAELLAISRRSLVEKLRRYGIRSRPERTAPLAARIA